MTQRRLGDRFELREMLGRGGMGTVWRARDLLLDRFVAIKEVALPPSLEAQPETRATVLREARLAARLNHSGAVTVYDAIEDGDQVFIIMELVDSETLQDRIVQEGPMAPAEAAELGLRLLDVLVAAHKLGIVHRDVKPGNVMVSAHGEVKLADFGIARLDGDSTSTASGIMVGSPAYMAPEQIQGRSAPSSDLWALGVTLFFAVEGISPFRRDTGGAALAAVLAEPPPVPVRAGNEFGRLLLEMLAKPVTERPSADQIRARLTAIRGETTVSAQAPAPVPPPMPMAPPMNQPWGPPPQPYFPAPRPPQDPWLIVAGVFCLLGFFAMTALAISALLGVDVSLIGVATSASSSMDSLGFLAPLATGVVGVLMLVTGILLCLRGPQRTWAALLAGSTPFWASGVASFLITAQLNSDSDYFWAFLGHSAAYTPGAVAAVIATVRVVRGPLRRRWVLTGLVAVVTLGWYAAEFGPRVWVASVVAQALAVVAIPVLATLFASGRDTAKVLAGWVAALAVALFSQLIAMPGYERFLGPDNKPLTEMPPAWITSAVLSGVAIAGMTVLAFVAARSREGTDRLPS
ncbi:serine/threonine-protein kinase [Amycolatopsis lurida]